MDFLSFFTGQSGSGLSMWSLFLAADPLVKLIMVLLVLASVWCWAIIVEKTSSTRFERRQAEQFEDAFWSGGSADALYDDIGSRPRDAMTRVFAAGMREWRRAKASGLATASRSDLRVSLLSRVDRSMSFTITREMERLERGGSVSPFVGLLGTVWGIMNSFQSIAESKSTNLAVVAPGIAEALLATALGLAAAIPAVIAYNKFAGDLERVGGRLETFAQEFSTLLARQLDEGGS